MRILKAASLSCLVVIASSAGAAHALNVKSPHGKVSISFAVKDVEGAKSCPVYSVSYKGKTVVAESRLGLELEEGPLKEELQIVNQTKGHSDSTWKPVYGERSTIRDNFNQVEVQLKEDRSPHRLLTLTFRAYDEGAAFCYTIPKQEAMDRVSISKESTEFRFLADHTAWAVYRPQGIYEKVTLSRIRPGCERPLTIQLADDVYVALAEARLVDYARMKFAPLSGRVNSLVSELSSAVAAALPLRTPWRVVMVADSPGRLLENNDIILNLNDPCAIADTSWIKPGKVLRDVTLSTVGGKACVDFAAKHNLQYVEFDTGWYGPENSADARTVGVNPNRPQGSLDLQEVIRYADERGVGILLYVGRGALERQLADLLPVYQKWGAKGIKYGFVNVGSQRWTSWLHDAIRQTAQYQLMVDVHDKYRPTGYSRTYPNFLTQEGIHGDEESPVNSVTLTLLFTRVLAGAADNTICYYDRRVDRNATHAYQLAKAVCFYSPFQFLYWYDRPYISPQITRRAPDAYNILGDEPELEFFDHCPTVWNDTRVIHGSIGEYAVIARRSGENWFIGCMNSEKPRTFDVPLEFLDRGRKYVAHVYSDDPTVPTRTHVRIDRFAVDPGTVLKVTVSAKGGQAVRIVPEQAMSQTPDRLDSTERQGKVAAKPLFRDPVFDGAADPVVCWNRQERKWFMFYTNRRANVPNTPGVSWVHGTRIGIAESSDGGSTWKYRGTADINYGEGDYSHWAPDVLYHDGTYHMFLTFVPGMHTDWSGTRDIIHLTSTDMLEWNYESTLKLSSKRVIDACVMRLPDGTWRMWYNNETDRKSIYYADSRDLFTWEDRGKAIGDRPGEGPKVFRWKSRYWMVVDVWEGLGIYSSDDCLNWARQEKNLLQQPGQIPTDRGRGGHPDVVVSGERAFLFYFIHQGGRDADPDDPYSQRRSVIQVIELIFEDGRITCDRDKPTHILLQPINDDN